MGIIITAVDVAGDGSLRATTCSRTLSPKEKWKIAEKGTATRKLVTGRSIFFASENTSFLNASNVRHGEYQDDI